MNTELYINILVSIGNVLLGFSIAFIVSFFLTLVMYECKVIKTIFYPIIELLRPIPNAAFVPITIMMANTITGSIVAITFIGAFFPMFLNIYRAYININETYIIIIKLYKLNLCDRHVKVIIPAIIENIFTSIMLGISGAWASVIMAEMISGKNGIGYYTWKAYTLLDYEKVLVGIFFIGILGFSMSYIIRKFSDKRLFWVRRER